jgi:hypothetical protein
MISGKRGRRYQWRNILERELLLADYLDFLWVANTQVNPTFKCGETRNASAGYALSTPSSRP